MRTHTVVSRASWRQSGPCACKRKGTGRAMLEDLDALEAELETHDRAVRAASNGIVGALRRDGFDAALGDLDRLNEDAALLLKRIRAQWQVLAAYAQADLRQAGYSRRRKLGLQKAERSLKARRKAADDLREALRAAHAGDPRPLYPPRARRDAGFDAVTNRVLDVLGHAANPGDQDSGAAQKGYFPDIHLPMSDFLAHIHAAHRVLCAMDRPRPWRFLDVGCGGGVKVLAAAGCFPQVAGLEYDPGYAGAADRLMAAGQCSAMIHQGDGLTWDGYGDFDVLYFYMPIRNDAGLIRLEERIAGTATPGTVLVAPYQSILSRHRGLGCAHICGSIYVAGMDQDEADALHAAACRIGPDLTAICPAVPDRLGVWAAMIAACRRLGFDPLA